MFFFSHERVLEELSLLKNGKKSDIEQKGGRGLSQNHSFLLPKKNDICVRKEGVKSSCHGFFSE